MLHSCLGLSLWYLASSSTAMCSSCLTSETGGKGRNNKFEVAESRIAGKHLSFELIVMTKKYEVNFDCVPLKLLSEPNPNSTQLNSKQLKSNFVGLDIVLTWNSPTTPNFSVTSRPARELKFGTDTH